MGIIRAAAELTALALFLATLALAAILYHAEVLV